MKLKKLKIELTKHCTLACAHCSAFAHPLQNLALPYLRVEQLIKEFTELGGEEITFTGGEPFLYEGLPNLLRLASENRLSTVVFTSGVLKRDKQLISLNAGALSDYSVLPNKAVFSLYDATPDGHELVTKQSGSFQLTIESIEKCPQLGIAVDLHFVLTKRNVDVFPELVKLAEHLHCQTIRILRYVPHGRGKKNRDELQPDYIDMKRFIDLLRTLKPLSGVEMKLGSAFGFIAPDMTSNCTAGVEELVVDAYGNIYPCSAFVNVRVLGQHGNVLQSSLADIWNSSEYLRQVRNVLQQRKQCTTDHNCHPGCIAQKTIVQGFISDNINDPDQIGLLG